MNKYFRKKAQREAWEKYQLEKADRRSTAVARLEQAHIRAGFAVAHEMSNKELDEKDTFEEFIEQALADLDDSGWEMFCGICAMLDAAAAAAKAD